MSRFCPSCGDALGEQNRYCVKCDSKRKAPTESPPENIKRTTTLDDFIQEKGKKDMAFLSKKRFGIPVVALLVPGHLRLSIPEHTFRGFDKCRVV